MLRQRRIGLLQNTADGLAMPLPQVKGQNRSGMSQTDMDLA
jgi:hypothetical protein